MKYHLNFLTNQNKRYVITLINIIWYKTQQKKKDWQNSNPKIRNITVNKTEKPKQQSAQYFYVNNPNWTGFDKRFMVNVSCMYNVYTLGML